MVEEVRQKCNNVKILHYEEKACIQNPTAVKYKSKNLQNALLVFKVKIFRKIAFMTNISHITLLYC